jgi:hypothetical protein
MLQKKTGSFSHTKFESDPCEIVAVMADKRDSPHAIPEVWVTVETSQGGLKTLGISEINLKQVKA